MILSFSTNIDGRQTYFVEKIWDGLLRNDHVISNSIYTNYMNKHKKRFGKPWDLVNKVGPQIHFPKIHTIRQDSYNRWKVGMPIHFTINNRTKNSFKFAPIIPVTRIQKIIFDYFPRTDSFYVCIDGHYVISDYDRRILAMNDGFDNYDDFKKYFIKYITIGSPLVMKIIHWTDFKY